VLRRRLRIPDWRPRRPDARDRENHRDSGIANTTTRYKLARLLPQDIGREFLSRTKYRIVADPSEADAVLTGTLANFSAYPTVSDPVSGRATAAEAVVTLHISLKDRRTGKSSFREPGRSTASATRLRSTPNNTSTKAARPWNASAATWPKAW